LAMDGKKKVTTRWMPAGQTAARDPTPDGPDVDSAAC